MYYKLIYYCIFITDPQPGFMNYKENFSEHYSLSHNNFWNGFFYFFGGRYQSYRKAIKTIRERQQHEAMALDIENLRNDCANVIITHSLHRNKHSVDAS